MTRVILRRMADECVSGGLWKVRPREIVKPTKLGFKCVLELISIQLFIVDETSPGAS